MALSSYKGQRLFLLSSVSKQVRQDSIVDFLGIPSFPQHFLRIVAMKRLGLLQGGRYVCLNS